MGVEIERRSTVIVNGVFRDDRSKVKPKGVFLTLLPNEAVRGRRVDYMSFFMLLKKLECITVITVKIIKFLFYPDYI